MAETSTPTWEQYSTALMQRGASDDQLVQAQGKYFEDYVAPYFDSTERPEAWNAFVSQAGLPSKPSLSSEFGKGFGRGLNTIGQGVVGTVATGMESVERNFPGTIAPENMSRVREMERQQTRDRQQYASPYADWDNVHGPGDFGRFIAANTGEGLATSAAILSPMGVPGAVASAGALELGNIHKQAADRAEAQSYLSGSNPDKYYENIDTGKLAGGTALATSGELIGTLAGPFRGIIAGKGSIFSRPFDLLNRGGAATKVATRTGTAVLGEGATEFGQTYAEEYGAGNPDWAGPETYEQAKSAGISAMGGALLPGLGGAFYQSRQDRKLTSEPISSGPSVPPEPGMGQLPPPEPPPKTDEEIKAEQYQRDADILSRIQGIAPDVFSPRKRNPDPNKPLEFSEFRKQADQAWKSTVPTPRQDEVMPAFLEASASDPSLNFDKFYKEAVKAAQDEHAKANPKPSDAEVVQGYQAYRQLHLAGIRDFDTAHQKLREYHYPTPQAEKDITPPSPQLEGPAQNPALPSPLGQQYRDAADAIERGDYGPPSADSAALLRNLADRHEQASRELNQQNSPAALAASKQAEQRVADSEAAQRAADLKSIGPSEAETLQRRYGYPGRGQLDIFGFPPGLQQSDANNTVGDPAVTEASFGESGPRQQILRQMVYPEAALPSDVSLLPPPMSFKLRQEADAIERGDYGPGHPLAIQALRELADRHDAATSVAKYELENPPPPKEKPRLSISQEIDAAIDIAAGSKKGDQQKIKGWFKKSREAIEDGEAHAKVLEALQQELDDKQNVSPATVKLRSDFINILNKRLDRAKKSIEKNVGRSTEGGPQQPDVRAETQGQSETDNAPQGEKVASEETIDVTRSTGETSADVSEAVGGVQKASERKRGATRVSRLDRGRASDAGADSNAGATASEEGAVSNNSKRKPPLNEAQLAEQLAVSEIEDKYDVLELAAQEKFFAAKTPEETEAARAEINRLQIEKKKALEDLKKGDPLIRFSRANSNDASSVFTPELVKSTAERFAGDRLRGVRIEVVPDESALPEKILEQAKKDGALGEIRAVHWDGKVILVANKMKSEKDIREAILHEGTHLGRLALFGRQARAAYNRLWGQLGGRKGLEKWIEKLGVSAEMEPYWDTARAGAQAKEDPNELRFMLVDEFLAIVQGKLSDENFPKQLKRWVMEFWGAVRQGARRFGIKPDTYTEADLRYLLKNLRDSAKGADMESDLGDPVRFSRKPKAVVDDVSERVTDFIKDAYQDKIPTAAKLLLNPHQIATLYPKYPALRRIANLLDAMQAETVRKQQAFASIVEDIAALPSAIRGQLLDVMTSATLYDLHPDVAFRDAAGMNAHLLAQPEKELLHAKVSAQYRALPKSARDLYVRARDEFAKSWTERFEAVRELSRRLDLPDKERERLDNELQRISAKIKGPYFPLFREGNWTVVWKSPAMIKAEESNDRDTIDALKGSPSDFFYFRTDSKSLAKRVAETAPSGLAEGSSSEGPYRHVKNDSSAQGVTTEFMQKVEAAITNRLGGSRQEEADEAIAALRAVFINAMPDMSVMKRTLARRGVAGVSSDDMLKAIARAGSADAFYLSRIKFADRLTRLLQELRLEDANPRRGEKIDPSTVGTPKGGDGGVYQAMLVNYRANMQPPDESMASSLANKLTAIHYFKTLVLSPAFMITNMMQPWLVSAPVMSPRFSDKSVSKELGQATLEAFNLAKPKSLRPEDLAKYELDLSKIKNDGERKMLEVLKDRGRIEISQARDLAALAKSNAYWLNRAVRVGASFSHMTETVNRLAAALASYRLEKDRLGKDPNIQTADIERRATEYADEIVRDTQVDYSPAGMPTFMKMGRQGVRRLMFQYKRYMQAMAFLYWKIGSEAFAGDSRALKAFAGLSLSHFLAAGAAGMAVYPLLLAIGMTGADDDETAEEALDAMVLEMAGGDKKLARAIRLGLPTYMGVDLSKKVGQGDLATLGVRLDPQGDTTPEKITNFLVDLIPSIDVLTSAGKAWDTFQQSGSATRAFGAFGFKPLSDLAKTVDTEERGLTNKAGTVQYLKAEQYDWVDKIWKSLGFSPAVESEHYRAAGAKRTKEDYYRTQKTKLLDAYARAKTTGAQNEVAAAETAMREFSNKVPENMKEFKIRAQDWIKHLNNIKRQNKRMDETGVSVPKKGGKWIEETVSPYEVTP